MLTLADPAEHEQFRAEMRHVMAESWPIEDHLLALVDATGSRRRDSDPGGPGASPPAARIGDLAGTPT